MPGPSLEAVCRALIQTVRAKMAAAVASKPVLVAMHTSVDVRQATTEAHPGDPALLTFPCVLIGLPALIEDGDRRQPLGFNIYRDANLGALTIVKEPYPRFYDLLFQVQVHSQRVSGDGGLFGLVQAMTAWAQEQPRVAGLFTEWRTNFGASEPDPSGDVTGASGLIRVRDWPCYGGRPTLTKLVAVAELVMFANGAIVD